MEFLPVLVKLRKVTRFINMENKRIEKQYGVSLPQILCLHWLYKQPDYLASARTIGEYLQLNASTVTGIVQRLEKRGMIARYPNSSDLRGNHIVLTAKGFELLQDISVSSPSLFTSLNSAQIAQVEAAVDLLIDHLEDESGIPDDISLSAEEEHPTRPDML